jgi:hypothetical protein
LSGRQSKSAQARRIKQFSFEKGVLASLAVVMVATFGALANAAMNFQAFI